MDNPFKSKYFKHSGIQERENNTKRFTATVVTSSQTSRQDPVESVAALPARKSLIAGEVSLGPSVTEDGPHFAEVTHRSDAACHP